MRRGGIFVVLVGCAAACTSFGADGTSPSDASVAVDAAVPDAEPGVLDAAPEPSDAATDAKRIDPPRDSGRDAPPRLDVAFLTSLVPDPGGRDAADRVCAQEALDATLAGTFIAYYGVAPVLMGGIGQPPEVRVLPTGTWRWASTAEVALRGASPTMLEGTARGPDGSLVSVSSAIEVWVAWSAMGFKPTSYATLPNLFRNGEGAGARRLLCFERL
ncbi:MAG: hypothetical protein IPK71_15790 [Myxococcales bacterium]|nr:hypothetical protein [Myxococcales bacterium]